MDYNPPANKPFVPDGPTRAAVTVVQILDDNIDLLTDSAEKSIVRYWQSEPVFRLNPYYDFIFGALEAMRTDSPLFQALKKIGSIYLIGGDEAKAIGQLVSDLSKFNGIFRQEEIYEFVQRRQDWPVIKRHVEKVMYGCYDLCHYI
ncbi:F-box protein: endocytic membrane traffic, recycling ReCYcling 1 [Clavispora lusitaniae]|nr:F-box protein: endocytic membrane traffic, recycling ReCYcling 1 [Clavispora lusitaniae]